MKRADASLSLRPLRMAAIVALGMAFAASPARPDFVLGIATDSFVAGSSTNFLEVTLTNTDPAGSTSVAINSFAFEITAADPSVTFENVAAADGMFSYIFPSPNSLFGPDITNGVSPDGQTIAAADLFATPNSGTVVAPGQTVSLGLVEFALSAATPSSPIGISLTQTLSGTSLSDADGNTITPTLDPNAAITPSSVVPEPSSILLVGAGLLLVAGVGGRGPTRRSIGLARHAA